MKLPLLLAATLLSASSAYAQCPNNDTVGSINFFAPTPVPTGATYFGNLSVIGQWLGNSNTPEIDAFGIEVAPGRTVDITVLQDPTQGNLYLQLYEGTTQVDGAAANFLPEINLTFTNTGTATQSLTLVCANAVTLNSCHEYTLSILNDVCPGDDILEDNDSCALPEPLILIDPTFLGRLAVLDGDDDWYSVTLQSGETLDASIFFEHARADVDLQLVDRTGGACAPGSLDVGFSVTDDEFVTHTNTTGQPQEVAIGVTFFGSTAGNTCNDYELAYEITAVPDDEFEDNDTICTAVAMQRGVYGDLIVTDADSDFYSMQVFDGQRVRTVIDFPHAEGDLDMRVWDLNAGCGSPTLVATSDSITDREQIEWVGSGPGLTEYVIEVYYFPSDGGSNDYELTIGYGFATSVGESVCVGAANSTGTGSILYGDGSTSVAANDLELVTFALPNNIIGFYNGSMGYRFIPNAGGSNGNLCIAGGSIGRFLAPGQLLASGATDNVRLAIDLTNLPQPTSTVAGQPGDVWFFQFWHRDSVGGQAVSNFSGALRIELTL